MSTNHSSPLTPVPTEQLRWRCDAASLGFATTAELDPVQGVIGQDNAVEALRFGLATNAPGHHVYVRGLLGTGRITLIRRLMEEITPACPESMDRCYAHNFDQPDRPRLINLPRGQGRLFVRLIDDVANFTRDGLKTSLEADVLKLERQRVQDAVQREVRELTQPFEDRLRTAGLGLVTINMGPVTQPRIAALVKGEPVLPESFEEVVGEKKLSAKQAQKLTEQIEELSVELDQVGSQAQRLQTEHQARLQELLQEQVRSLLAPFTERVLKEFDTPVIREFLDELVADVTNKRLQAVEEGKDFSRLYRVNLIVHHESAACPTIAEITPSLPNLLGTIDRDMFSSGEVRSDHMMIRAGSLLRADGGFLLLDARDVLTEPTAWRLLVRTLRTGMLEIVPPELEGPWSGPSIKPEAIDINVKVVLVGDAETYYMLDAYDPDFPHLFKVLADFATTMPRTEDSVRLYAGVLARIAREESLPAFDASAVARLAEHGARIAAEAEKLTSRFARIGDIAREAVFVAQGTGDTTVTGEHVSQAIQRTKDRADLPARRFRRLIADGTIQVQLDGVEVGQINGLAVVHAGPLVYGFPQRITATAGPGGGGVINIDREADLSGSIHTKGFYILAGLLRSLLQAEHPLTFDASLAFEQSYGGIDGDSASGAEMCCLLSALTGATLRQDLAMTGAIDQKGHLMAIGAVNEKIEGFFDACTELCDGDHHGCIIPQSNVSDLMLREDVVEACADGCFGVYAVSNVLDALALLTGERGDTLIEAARRKARAYWEAARLRS